MKTALWGIEKCIGVVPGQYFDTESGLHYNYHRYYDPSIGRYITPDPIGQAGGINLYTYANLNPLNFIDPLGLFDLFGFIEGDAAAVFGIEGAMGIVFDIDNIGESGIFVTKSGAAGANLGWGAGGGFAIREIEGISYNVDINAGTISPTFNFDKQGWNGFALAKGLGVGVSFSIAETKTYTLFDMLEDLKNLWKPPWANEKKFCE